MANRASSAEKNNGEAFTVGGWRVDPSALRVSNEFKTVKLEPKAMAVLKFLASRPGDVITRQELELSVWAGTVVGYDALSNAINKLRKAFGDKARNPQYIETIAKSGYRLIARVRLAEENTPQQSPGTSKSVKNRQNRLPRKLAAILYADVVDYSRLTHEDEDATHFMLNEYLNLFAECVETNCGRVMHYAGDALLAMFDAAIDAVNCAREVQQEIDQRNETIPAGRGIQFRIGVNSGDVFEDRGDVYGEGVNIAARLEGLAQAGGICVSEAVRTAIGNKMGVDFVFVGEHVVKNIDEPVRVYTVNGTTTQITGVIEEFPSKPSKPSIAVLAFDNMSGEADQEYFSDGISEDITTDLSKLSGLLVIARNSAFAYKGRAVNVGDISRELGVRYVLEGSVRRIGQRVRVNAQMIDSTSGGHVWAERYDRDVTDIFSVQDELTRDIVAALAPTLTGKEMKQLNQSGTANFEAYDYFLKGREQALLDTEKNTSQAQILLNKAIELDPSFSSAYAHLGRSYGVAYINNWCDPSDQSLETGLEFCRKAVTLDNNSPFAHFAVGIIAFWLRMDLLAQQEINTAISLDPNFAEGYGALSMIQVYSGEPQQALESLQITMRLDPHYRDIYLHLMGLAYFHLQQYAKAIDALKRRLIRKPESDISRVLLASSYGHLGEFDKSGVEWNEAMQINPNYSIEQKRQLLPYKNPADFEFFADGLRKAGLLES